jgi:hypothetical protein
MPLRNNALNVVGENHKESGARRNLEMEFCQEKSGSPNYWKENEFPDGGADDDDGADLMELRAAHGVALLIKVFEGLCDRANEVGAIPAVDPTAGAEVTAFVTKNLDTFNQTRQRIKNSWQPTRTDVVNNAVQAVYDRIDHVLDTYKKIMEKAVVKSQIAMQLQATQLLAKARADVTGLLPDVLASVGASASDTADTLAQRMRTQRSAFMGFGAAMSKLKGVWKIGDGHIDDLITGAAKVQNRTANFVTKDDFNNEFNTWRALNHK